MVFHSLLVTNVGSCPFPCYKRKWRGREASENTDGMCLRFNIKREKNGKKFQYCHLENKFQALNHICWRLGTQTYGESMDTDVSWIVRSTYSKYSISRQAGLRVKITA